MVQRLVSDAHRRFKSNGDGHNSQVYPALARVPQELFGICVAGTSGRVYEAGDTEHKFSIMSVSKPFVFALVCETIGPEDGARKTWRERHRLAVQLARRHRAGRWPHQSDGECGRDRDDEPRAGA
jgi:glutaminase